MILRAVASFLMLCVCSSLANAICPPQWAPTFTSSDFNNTVSASVVFDDGTGPALWVGGAFTTVSGVPALRVAKYDGTHWTQPGRGLNNSVLAFAVYDNHLYAAGTFTTTAPGTGSIAVNRIARWNGTDWESVGIAANNGVNSTVNALAVFNNELYLGGLFTTAGTTAAVNRIARWNGSTWSTVASGLNNTINTLKVMDDGTGSKLWIGGLFTASGTTTNILSVARWDGTTISPAGVGFTGGATNVNTFALFNGSVYAAGTFTNSGVNSLANIARWNGTQWVDVGGGANNIIESIFAYNDGSGNALYVSGSFTTTSAGTFTTSPRFVRWNGAAWVNTGDGLPNGVVNTAVPYNDGTGTALYLGGTFTSVGVAASGGPAATRLAKWNGSFLSSPGHGVSGTINAFASTSAATPSLLVVGAISRAGTQRVNQVALFDGSTWTPVGTSDFNTAPISAIDFNGTYYVGGNFTTYGLVATTRIASWNGSAFVGTGTVFNASVRAFAKHGTDLYAAGDFTIPAGRIAKLTGTTWSPLGVGMGNGLINDIASFNGELYAAGSFTLAGGAAATRIAKWNGSIWSPLGNGLNNTVNSLAVFNNELFVAGAFTTAGPGPASRVARWDGANWSDAAGGMNGTVEDLVVINDAGTQTLFAVGTFTLASGSAATNIAVWNGCRWEPVGSGLPVATTNLCAINSGPAKGVYVAGTLFSTAGGEAANNIAHIQTCVSCPADLDDGSGTGSIDGGVTIDDLLYFLTKFENGDIAADLDNGNGQGLCDGGVTIDDLLFFLVRFEGGC